MKKMISNKKTIKYVILAVIALIPFMYSFFYLKAFWNPYGQIDEISIAIVNSDKSVNGINRGKQLVDKLIEKDTLNIFVVNENKAYKGLNNKTFYAVITIPSDFTSNISNIDNVDRSLTRITYTPNQKSNYLASQIISRIMLEVESELKSNISSEIVKNLTNKMNEVPIKIEEINNGIRKINNGISEVYTGSSEINSGLLNFSSGYKNFNYGLKKISASHFNLINSFESINLGLNVLDSGIGTLKNSTNDLSNLSSSINGISISHDALTSSINNYVDSVSSIDSSYSNLVENICISEGETSLNCLSARELKDNLNSTSISGLTIKESNSFINQSIKLINTSSSKLGTINDSLSIIKDSAFKLKNGSNDILYYSNILQSNMDELTNSSDNISTKIDALYLGSNSLNAGLDKIYNSINNSINEIDSNNLKTKQDLIKLKGLDEYTKNSVSIEENDLNGIKEYGIAFAPYFMSLSLWIGSLMLFVVLYYDVLDRFPLFSRNNKNNIKRSIAYMLLASVQALALGFLLKIGLGFETTSNFLYYGSLILVANTFLLIIEFLIISFNDVGKFVALVLLVLQLAASGGTFPIETVPTFFKNIYNFMPMKYSINLFKESLITKESFNINENSLVLILLLIGSIISISILKIIKTRIINKKNSY